MLPKIVQQVFDEYDKKHAKNLKTVITEEQSYLKQQLELDFLTEATEFERQECLRVNRVTRYQVMAMAIIIGILQAIYFTYLLT